MAEVAAEVSAAVGLAIAGAVGKRADLGRQRRGGRIAVQRRGVLRPKLAVLGFQLRDHVVVQAQHVGLHRLGQLGAVGRDQRRGHHRGEHGLKGRRRRLGLGRGVLGLTRGGGHPAHIRLHRGDHRRRGRAQPRLAGQRATTLSKPCAVEASSAATAFQAEAADVNDDDPGPE